VGVSNFSANKNLLVVLDAAECSPQQKSGINIIVSHACVRTSGQSSVLSTCIHTWNLEKVKRDFIWVWHCHCGELSELCKLLVKSDVEVRKVSWCQGQSSILQVTPSQEGCWFQLGYIIYTHCMKEQLDPTINIVIAQVNRSTSSMIFIHKWLWF